MDLISVIVPVYNVEKYLDRCVQSIVNQTYKNLEIILVDDGSPDNCGKMCDDWAQKDSRIKVVHKANGGLSDARNAGMAVATGEYIAFVDSDDWVEVDFVVSIINIIKSENCKVAGCNFRKVRDKTQDVSIENYNLKVFKENEIMSAIIDESIKQVVWNKIYTADLIRNILFEKGKYHEDEFWSYQVFAKTDKYAETEYVGYNYFQRESSIMGEQYSIRRLDAVEAKVQRQVFMDTYFPEIAEKSRLNLLFTCIYNGQLVLKYFDDDVRDDTINYLKKIVKDIKVDKSTKRQIKITHRLWVELTQISFVGVCKLRNLLRVGM